ncbi:hypothetical protein H2204_009844 [Knufia peltigerae]|nr:hypothetical protein H2204_009844 [Knufia peltigerae]
MCDSEAQTYGYSSLEVLSEHFADLARASARTTIDQPSIPSIQANLVLAMYELLTRDGIKAWMFSGVATRQAQALRLGVELHSKHSAREKETRRRVFWACFIMDRLVAYTCSRPQMIGLESVRLQLPCPDRLFAFGDDYNGPNLNTVMSHIHQIVSIGLMPFFICILSLWSEIVYLQMRDGRRGALHPPSDPNGPFSRLEIQVEEFQAALPLKAQWSPENYRAYNSMGQGKLFIYLHLLLNHARFALHQEYLPQQDGPVLIMVDGDNNNANDTEMDGAGLSLNYTDDRIISVCLSGASAIAEIVSFIWNAEDGTSREPLRSVVAVHPIMAAAAVQMWAQYTRQQGPEHDDTATTPQTAYKDNVILFATVIQSWKPRWKIAYAFDETLDSVQRLYESSYLTSPWDNNDASFGGVADDEDLPGGETNSTPCVHSGNTVEGGGGGAAILVVTGDGNANATPEVAEGSGLPDPEQVCQRLFDKIRYTMLVSLEAPDVKRRMLNVYLRTLWIHVWKSTTTTGEDFVDWEQ